MSKGLEHCCVCDDPTGHAGAGDGSIYLIDGALGPLCDECYHTICEECSGEAVPREAVAEIERLRQRVADLEAENERLRQTSTHNPGKHAGDCTFFSSTVNGLPTDGICNCGYGMKCRDRGDYSQAVSEERQAAEAAKAAGGEA